MCGIAGSLNFSGNHQNTDIVKQMLDVMDHRGPDSEGLWNDNDICLGHKRLAIIDLSSSANQPMVSEDGTFITVFNGEIYNFFELKHELEKQGVVFRTNSDTEVLVEGCKLWGVLEFTKRAEGMWAFAVWDKHKKELWLCRDRLGQKPLYFIQQDNTLRFASTLTALRKTLPNPDIDLESMHQFLGCRFVPPHRSIYLGVEKIPPASCFVFNTNGHKSWKYWRPNFSEEQEMSESEAIAGISKRLKKAVDGCMISDVPLGFNLSGGVDSSLVTALAVAGGHHPMTFTMSLPGETIDESPYAQAVASKLGTDHHTIPLKIDSLKFLTKLGYYFGEPYGDPSAIPSYFVAQETRRWVTVCLNGDGGDEVFGGYPYTQIGHKLDSILKYIPKSSLPLFNLANEITSRIPGFSILARKIDSLGNLLNEGVRGFFIRRFGLSIDVRKNLYQGTRLEKFVHDDYADIIDPMMDQGECRNDLSRILFSDLIFNLPGDYCAKVDSATMAVSLESRSPFLEHQVIDFVSRIPTNILLKGQEQKYLLKKYASKFIPRHCIYRKKQGFSLPITKWLSGPEGRKLRNLVKRGRLVHDNLLNPSGIDFCFSRLQEERHYTELAWNIICMEIWYRTIHNNEELDLA